MIWTTRRLIEAAKASDKCEWRPVSQMSDFPCTLNRLTKKGKRKESVIIYEDRTILRGDIERDRTRMRPQDAARVLKLEK